MLTTCTGKLMLNTTRSTSDKAEKCQNFFRPPETSIYANLEANAVTSCYAVTAIIERGSSNQPYFSSFGSRER